jgi:hypothetical protein
LTVICLLVIQAQAQGLKSKAAECAAIQTLRELAGARELAKPLDCAAFPRFGLH